MMAGLPTPGTQPEEEWRESLNVRLECADCRDDPPELFEDHASGDLICANCGLVLQERSIATSSEWRAVPNDDQANDPNALLSKAHLYTDIALGDNIMHNNELRRAQRKATWDRDNESLIQALEQIAALCNGWQLPTNVSDTAKHLFKDANESKIFKGRSQDALIAGCVFLACRQHQVPRSVREVVELTKISEKEIWRIFKLLETFLKQEETDEDIKGATVMAEGDEDVRSATLAEVQELLLPTNTSDTLVFDEEYKGNTATDPKDLCARYCSMLGLQIQTTNVALALAEQVTKTGALAGRSPLSSAAACIFMAGHLMGEPKTPKEIQRVARVSDGTFRHAYKLLYQNKDELVTEEMLGRGADPNKLPVPS